MMATDLRRHTRDERADQHRERGNQRQISRRLACGICRLTSAGNRVVNPLLGLFLANPGTRRDQMGEISSVGSGDFTTRPQARGKDARRLGSGVLSGRARVGSVCSE